MRNAPAGTGSSSLSTSGVLMDTAGTAGTAGARSENGYPPCFLVRYSRDAAGISFNGFDG